MTAPDPTTCDPGLSGLSDAQLLDLCLPRLEALDEMLGQGQTALTAEVARVLGERGRK